MVEELSQRELADPNFQGAGLRHRHLEWLSFKLDVFALDEDFIEGEAHWEIDGQHSGGKLSDFDAAFVSHGSMLLVA